MEEIRHTPTDYVFNPSMTMFGTVNANYPLWMYDEALLNCPESARAMRRDASIMSLLQCRYLATVSRNWEIISLEDEHKPQAVYIEKILKKTPKLAEYFRVLLEAIWFGKQGICNNFSWNGTEFYIKNWVPIQGDKLTVKADYGEDGEPVWGYLVNPNLAAQNKIEASQSMRGLAHFPTEEERDAYVIHTHWNDDQWSQEPMLSILAHGSGVRNYIYYAWLQKNVLIGNIAQWAERVGTGLRLYFYESGNPQSLADMKQVAAAQNSNTNIFIPRLPATKNEEQSNAIEFIDPPTGGIDAVQDFIGNYFDASIQRMILGQSLTTDAQPTGLGSNLADVQERTFFRIIDYDARNLAETITEQLVKVLCKYNFGSEFPIQFKFLSETQDVEGKLEAISKAKSLGMTLSQSSVRQVLNIPEPESVDDRL